MHLVQLAEPVRFAATRRVNLLLYHSEHTAGSFLQDLNSP
jgi:hypothetical protein